MLQCSGEGEGGRRLCEGQRFKSLSCDFKLMQSFSHFTALPAEVPASTRHSRCQIGNPQKIRARYKQAWLCWPCVVWCGVTLLTRMQKGNFMGVRVTANHSTHSVEVETFVRPNRLRVSRATRNFLLDYSDINTSHIRSTLPCIH
jgi:hypothetical protein